MVSAALSKGFKALTGSASKETRIVPGTDPNAPPPAAGSAPAPVEGEGQSDGMDVESFVSDRTRDER